MIKSADETTVAMVCWRLGPYHHARFNAAGRLMSLHGLEACGMENAYAWDKIAGARCFERVTLTERHENSRRWRVELHRRMFEALDVIKPDVVAIPGWSLPDALSALSWCLHAGIPVIALSESTAWDERRVWWKEWIKRRVVGLCSAALVGGTLHADYMVQLGMPAERVFLGYDAVDNRYFEDKVAEVRSQKAEVRKKHGLPEKFFLASARFIEKKNLARLLRAYAEYREKSEDRGRRTEDGEQRADLRLPASGLWSLVILGDGPLKADLCRLISDLRLEHSVLLPGFKQYQELPAYYGLASAFVHASTTEQWGLVVNEAMASGLPVLVSDRCGCATDLVQEGVNGFTFDPCNVEHLAQLMFKLSAFQPFKLSAFGDASREMISGFGVAAFGGGLRQAVEVASQRPLVRLGLLDRLLLQLLLLK